MAVILRNRFQKHFRSALFYAVYGPPLGGLLFILFISASESTVMPNLIGVIFFAIPVAYILGAIPALVTGLIMHTLPPLPFLKKIIAAALIGFTATSLFVFIVDYSGAALLALGTPAALSAALLTVFKTLHFKVSTQ